MESTQSISVVIPAYNESEKIAFTIREVADYFKKNKKVFELIVVNDGSADDTAQKVTRLKEDYPEIRFVDLKVNGGKGNALKKGIALCIYKLCLFMDADNSTNIKEWDKFEAEFVKGRKAVIASRHLRTSKILHAQPWTRRFLGSGYRVFCRFLFGLSTSDFNCGFKAFDTELAKDIFSKIKMTDWTFDVEIFCLLKKQGIPAVEIPVEWEHSQKSTSSNPWVTAFKSLRSLWQLKRCF